MKCTIIIAIICVIVTSPYPFSHMARMRGRRIPNPRQIYGNQNMMLRGRRGRKAVSPNPPDGGTLGVALPRDQPQAPREEHIRPAVNEPFSQRSPPPQADNQPLSYLGNGPLLRRQRTNSEHVPTQDQLPTNSQDTSQYSDHSEAMNGQLLPSQDDDNRERMVHQADGSDSIVHPDLKRTSSEDVHNEETAVGNNQHLENSDVHGDHLHSLNNHHQQFLENAESTGNQQPSNHDQVSMQQQQLANHQSPYLGQRPALGSPNERPYFPNEVGQQALPERSPYLNNQPQLPTENSHQPAYFHDRAPLQPFSNQQSFQSNDVENQPSHLQLGNNPPSYDGTSNLQPSADVEPPYSSDGSRTQIIPADKQPYNRQLPTSNDQEPSFVGNRSPLQPVGDQPPLYSNNRPMLQPLGNEQPRYFNNNPLFQPSFGGQRPYFNGQWPLPFNQQPYYSNGGVLPPNNDQLPNRQPSFHSDQQHAFPHQPQNQDGSFNGDGPVEADQTSDGAVEAGHQADADLSKDGSLPKENDEDCDVSRCPELHNCVNSTVRGCCPVCVRQACQCEGYQYYDCVSNGFKNGLVPEGESYTVDMGSTICSCPVGGGVILCSFQDRFNGNGAPSDSGEPRLLCPTSPLNCIETYTRPDGCVECIAVGCVDEDGRKHQGGSSVSRPPCSSCLCPAEGGELLCRINQLCEDSQAGEELHTSQALEATQRVMRNPLSAEADKFKEDIEDGYDTRYLQPDWNNLGGGNPANAGVGTGNQQGPGVSHQGEAQNSVDSKGDGERNFPGGIAPPLVGPERKQPSLSSYYQNSYEGYVHPYKQPDPYQRSYPRGGEQRGMGQVYSQPADTSYGGQTERNSEVNPGSQSAPNLPESSEARGREGDGDSAEQGQGRFRFGGEELNRESDVNHASTYLGLNGNAPPYPDYPYNRVNYRKNSPETSNQHSDTNPPPNNPQSGSNGNPHYAGEGPGQSKSDNDVTNIQPSLNPQPYRPYDVSFRRPNSQLPLHPGDIPVNPNLYGGAYPPYLPQYQPVNPQFPYLFPQMNPNREVPYFSQIPSAAEGGRNNLTNIVHEARIQPTAMTRELIYELNNRSIENNQSTSFENVLSSCCHQGQQWGISHQSCDGIPVTVNTYGQICAVAQEKCCRESRDQESCKAGIATARSMAACDVTNGVQGRCDGDGFKTCCDCCALGLKAYSLSLNCDMQILGEPCNGAYSHCCRNGRITTANEAMSSLSPTHASSPSSSNPTSRDDVIPRCETHNNCPQVCIDVDDGIRCDCLEGFRLEENGVTCTDINECVLGTHNCLEGQFCLNLLGGFNCQRLISCGTGYELTDKNTCNDIDECALNLHNCEERLNCVNIRGSFRCVPKLCDVGYFTDATGGCIDIDECIAGDFSCPPRSRCENTKGSYVCRCPDGLRFDEDTRSCQDIDECQLSTSSCADGSTCVNTDGSYRCLEPPKLECAPGYEADIDGDTCIDVDECARGTHTCASGSTCINDVGSFRCEDPIQCREGTRPSPNRRSCIDINECSESSPCGEGGVCVNTHGSHRCECNRGFRKINSLDPVGLCEDIDECTSDDENNCMYRCENNAGSYSCACPEGYSLSRFGRTCQDVDECALNSDNCTSSQTCFNTRGSFRCVELDCPEHYAKLSNRRCMRQSCKSAKDKRACVKLPRQISFHNVTLLNNAPNNKALFRMSLSRGFPNDRYYFLLSEGNEDHSFRVIKKRLRRRQTGVVLTTRRLRGPAEYVLDLTLKLYRKKRWSTFISRLYVFVSQYKF